MAYLSRGIIRYGVTCGTVVGLGLLLSACDRPQPMPTPTGQEWQQEQPQPAQPEAQERTPNAPKQ